jgi:hypothetical protein
VDPWEFCQSIHGSIAFFGVLQPGHGVPAMGLLFSPGEERGKFEEHFAKLQEKAKVESVSSVAEYAGVEISVYEPSPDAKHEDPAAEEEEIDEGSDSGLEVSAIFDAGDWAGMAAAGSRERLLEMVHGMIDRMSGKDPSNGFGGDEVLSAARASVSKPGRVEGFLNISKLMSLLKQENPPSEEEQHVIDALALDDLRWAYMNADVGAGEMVGAEFAVRLPDSGYLKEWFACFGPIPRDMAGLAPRASSSINLAQIDVWALYQSIWKLVRELDSDAAEQAHDQMTSTLQQMGGLDLEKDFLSQLDGRFSSFNIPVPLEEWRAALGGFDAEELTANQAPPSGSAMVIGLRDPETVSAFVKGLMTAVGMFGQVETEEFQGTTVFKMQGMGGAGSEWAFTKSTAVFSQYPTALRAALRMQGAEAKDSALENERYKPLYAAHAQASVLGLASTAESFKSGLLALEMIGPLLGMGMVQGFAEAGGEGELPNFFEHLPSAAAIERHFHGTLVSSLTRKSGVLHLKVASQ